MSRSVWLDLDDITTQLDVKRLEELFPNQATSSTKKPKVEVKETKSLLDHNRAKNLGIFLVYVLVFVRVCIRMCVCVYVCLCTLVCLFVNHYISF